MPNFCFEYTTAVTPHPRDRTLLRARLPNCAYVLGLVIDYLWCHQIRKRLITYQTRPMNISSPGIPEDSLLGSLEIVNNQTIPTMISDTEIRVCNLNFLLVSWTVLICAPAAIASRAPEMGAPHLGQDSALSETSVLHSLQFIKAIYDSPLMMVYLLHSRFVMQHRTRIFLLVEMKEAVTNASESHLSQPRFFRLLDLLY